MKKNVFQISPKLNSYVQKLLIGITLILITSILLITFVTSPKKGFHTSTLRTINEKWTISCGTEETLSALPATFSNPDLNPVVFSKTLTEQDVLAQNIMFHSTQAKVLVSIDDQIIYRYEKPENTILPFFYASRYNTVRLPKNAVGKTIRIEMFPTLRRFAGRLPSIYSGKKMDLFLHILHYAIPQLFLIIILFFTAILQILYGKFSVNSTDDFKRRLRSYSFLLIDVCIVVLLESRVKELLFEDHAFSSYLLEITYFLLPVLLDNFLMTYESLKKDRIYPIISTFIRLQFIFIQIAILSGLSPAKLNGSLTCSFIIIYLRAIYVFHFQKKEHPDSASILILHKSAVFLYLGVIAEFINYHFLKSIPNRFFLLVFLTLFTFCAIILSIKRHYKEHLNNEIEKEKQTSELELSRIKLMIAQIQPHFLYNALTSIQTIILEDPRYAYRLLQDFSIHLRSVITSFSSDDFITLADEIKNVTAYLNIEKMRFGDALNVKYDLQEMDILVIPLSIQPFVENAVKHGLFTQNSAGGTIIIRSFSTSEDYYIQIIDDGDGFDTDIIYDTSRASSTGIRNCMYRAQKLLNAETTYESVIGKGTTVTITIPKS